MSYQLRAMSYPPFGQFSLVFFCVGRVEFFYKVGEQIHTGYKFQDALIISYCLKQKSSKWKKCMIAKPDPKGAVKCFTGMMFSLIFC
jgi:hypothetical protein